MAKVPRCPKCGTKLIMCKVGGTIPWLACPSCDAKELNQKLSKEGILL